jgi:hypothetical protein
MPRTKRTVIPTPPFSLPSTTIPHPTSTSTSRPPTQPYPPTTSSPPSPLPTLTSPPPVNIQTLQTLAQSCLLPFHPPPPDPTCRSTDSSFPKPTTLDFTTLDSMRYHSSEETSTKKRTMKRICRRAAKEGVLQMGNLFRKCSPLGGPLGTICFLFNVELSFSDSTNLTRKKLTASNPQSLSFLEYRAYRVKGRRVFWYAMPPENAATGLISFDPVFGGQSRSRFLGDDLTGYFGRILRRRVWRLL